MTMRKFKLPGMCFSCGSDCEINVSSDTTGPATLRILCNKCGGSMSIWTIDVKRYLDTIKEFEVFDKPIKLLKGFRLKRKN